MAVKASGPQRTARRVAHCAADHMSAVGGRILLARRVYMTERPCHICARLVSIGDKCWRHSVSTQWHALSAADTCLLMPNAVQSCGRVIRLCSAQTFIVIVDSKEVVGRRRRHQAGMRRCHPRGQRRALSGLSGQRYGRWCHVRHARMPECATLGSLFSRLNHL